MSIEAERALVGKLLTNPDSISGIYDSLTPDMFESSVYSRIYFEFRRAYESNVRANASYMAQHLADLNSGEFNINEEMKNCILCADSVATINTDASVIIHEFMARELNRILNIIPDSNNIEDQIAELQGSLTLLLGKQGISGMTMRDMVMAFRNDYFIEHPDNGIKLGIDIIDDKIIGVEGGDVCVLAARPAVGKSALAAQIARYVADHGSRIGFFNLEMKEKQIFERFVASESGIPLTRMRKAIKFLNDEEKRYNDALTKLNEVENLKVYTGSTSVSKITSICEREKFDIVLIDYLQLIKPEGRYSGNRVAEVGEISHNLKALAMKMNIPIIALSQLNRVSASASTKEPTMSELRESGDIEQDASHIILLWNPDENDRSVKGVKIEKNRQGELGTFNLYFDGGTMKFTDSKSFAQVSDSADLPF